MVVRARRKKKSMPNLLSLHARKAEIFRDLLGTDVISSNCKYTCKCKMKCENKSKCKSNSNAGVLFSSILIRGGMILGLDVVQLILILVTTPPHTCSGR